MKSLSFYVLVFFYVALNSVFALTAEEIDKLSEKEIGNLPINEVLPAIEMSEELYLITLENILLDLRYFYQKPTGKVTKELKNAIELYQRDIGQPATGTLTFGQFQKLSERYNLVDSGIRVYPTPTFKTINNYNDYAAASGVWVFENDKQANPLQTTKIECYRQQNLCQAATAEISTFNDHGNPLLSVEMDEWKITKWNEQELQAENGDALCVSYTLSINFKKKEAYMFRRGKGGDGCEGIAESPQILILSDGFDVGQKFWEDRNKEALKHRSSEFQKLMKAFKGK